MTLERGQPVILRLPASEGSIPARVEQADADVITLVLSTPGGLRGVDDAAAIVEYTTPRGIHRLSGRIADTSDSGVVRVRRDHHDVLQRRDFVRVDAVMPLQVTITGPVRGAAHTTTLNVSGGGLLLQDPIGLPADAVVELELQLLPGSAPVRARGKVVRELSDGVKGIRIDSIARDDRERLIRFVTERERHALRVARGH